MRLGASDPLSKGVVLSEWGDWLSSRWDWSWWVTLTYDPRKHASASASHTSVGWARSDADWSAWLDGLCADAARAGDPLDPPYWFRGREPNPYRYGTHFHALIGNVPERVSRREAWRRWFDAHGMARVEPYDPARGAGWYVSKYVVKQLGDWTFSENAGAWMKGSDSERAAEIPGTWNLARG